MYYVNFIDSEHCIYIHTWKTFHLPHGKGIDDKKSKTRRRENTEKEKKPFIFHILLFFSLSNEKSFWSSVIAFYY